MTVEEVGDDHTQDGTVDLRGDPVRRSIRGRWKACSFLVVYEAFERMAYFGISSNLVIYMTTKLHQGTVKSSNNVTNWVGTVYLTPILGAYIADAHLGRYRTFVIFSTIYFLGMMVLTLSVSIPGIKPPECSTANAEDCEKTSVLQLAVFFGALYTLAIGTGGTKPNISTIGADQFDETDPKEKVQKMSFFNWWMFSIFFGILFANTVLVYVQDNVGWGWGYGIPTLGLAVSILVFLFGTPYYRHKLPAGSAFMKMTRVIVASFRKANAPMARDLTQFHELPSMEYERKGTFPIQSTKSLRFLDRASLKTGTTDQWNLCTITEVEETKQMLNMLPVMCATFVPSVMLAQVNTLFVKQGTTLNARIAENFSIPPASLAAFVTVSFLVSIVLYDRRFVKLIRKFTGNPRGITLLQRMGIGIIIHILLMIVACFTERYRLKVAADHGLIHQKGVKLPLTIFVLLPQFVLMGIADAFLEVAKLEFFYDQAPDSMKSLGTSYSLTSFGIGNFLSSFLLSTVSNITKKRGRGWILNNLNESRAQVTHSLDVKEVEAKVMGVEENE
ncbi:protein NRT1/ PTR FAMILY 5.2-like isoform X2 [Raphanus sativus]|uniref:Protein NRT1/ PTR FAMILY 5.2-like isoform X2 n=1 Tax=Raphanus sativus TaxID=3726 RepID=A0A9W3CFG4_RAPSA|nr:protein NRT1/ PTR FAMILY 5.2-like isoform X2 [Raphanus sativus]